jgi:tetratricopeptide (TPR) repeat protein
MDSYRYAARFTGANEGLVLDDAPDAATVGAVKALAGGPNRPARTGWRRLAGLTPAGRTAVAAAIVTVFVAAVLWLRPGGGEFDPYSDALAPVTDALINASERNPLIIPGVEDEISTAPAAVRSGPAPVTRSLDEALSALAIEYNRGANSPDEAQWLIGAYIATGQLVNARVYLEDASRRYPSDPDVTVLAGMLAWSDSDLGRSAELFSVALEAEPNHPTALYNLAVVRLESGDTEGARELLERVTRLLPDSPLSSRAGQVLSKLPPPEPEETQ